MGAVHNVAHVVGAELAGRCRVAAGTRVVVACSGGADSTALVAVMGELRDRWPSITIGFVDHGLRDVRDERRAAEQAAERISAPCCVAHVDVSQSGNLQANARRERYRALAAMDSEAVVLTAHTADDQAETLLMRLLRGGGLRAWRGIAPRVDRVARPLLSTSRAALRDVGAAFAEDPTNAGDRYDRNRLRHDVIPALERFQPGAAMSVARAAQHAWEAVGLLDELLVALDVQQQPLVGLPKNVLATLLQWRAAREGIRPLRAASLRDAVDRLSAGVQDTRVAVGGSMDLIVERGHVRFAERNDGRFTIVAHGPGTYRLGTMVLTITSASHGQPQLNDASWAIPNANCSWPLSFRLSKGAPSGFIVNDSRGNQVVPIRKAAGCESEAIANTWLMIGTTTDSGVVRNEQGTSRARSDKGQVER